MGAAVSQCSCISANDDEAGRTSKAIDRGLKETRRHLATTPKLLLLGSGESGKSTILKQMRLINNIPFTEYEREAYRVQIFYNLVNGMRSLLDALRDLPPLDTEEASQVIQNPIQQLPVHAHAMHHHRPGVVSHNPPPPVFPNANAKPRRPLFGPVPPPSPTPPESTDSQATDDEEGDATSSVKEPLPSSSSPLDQQETKEDEESRSRSPSISLNLFASGSLTPRQLSLLHELNYPPDLRPGQPFPIEFESILRECWWGPTPDEYAALYDQHRRQGTSSEMVLTPTLPGAGAQLDRIAIESGVAIPDNLPYLFSSPKRLASFFHPDYMPTDEDILRCRGRTTGIQETVFQLGKDLGGALKAASSSPGTGASTGAKRVDHLQPLKIAVGKTKLHMVDVGGQRSERRKWIHCFQDVTAVLFLVGLSGYNQGLIEDSTANQMQDAMSLWDGVCSSQWFKNTALILFLNKTDLFKGKVGKFPIKTFFRDYEGGEDDVEAGMEYFRKRFLRIAIKGTRNMNNAVAAANKKSGTHEPLSSRTKSKTKSGTFSNPVDSKRKRSDVQEMGGASPTATTGTAGTTTMSSYGQTTLTPSTAATSTSSPRSRDKGKGRATGEALEMGERPSPTAGTSSSPRSKSGFSERERPAYGERERKESSARTIRTRKESAAGPGGSRPGTTYDSTGVTSLPKDSYVGVSSLPKNATGGSAVGKGRFVYTHFTNATDTDQLRIVILAVCDIILRDNFVSAHLI